MLYEKRNWLSGITPISEGNLEAMDDALFQNSKVAETIPALKETVNKNSKAIILLEGILNEEGLSGLLSEYFKKHPLEEALDVYPILEGNEPPTPKTKGEKRQLYYYIDGNTLYICRGYGNGGYMWELASSQLTDEQISTALSEYLKNNPVSPVGKDGITPHIGDNGNWYIGDEDTGVKAVSKDGYSPKITVSETDTGYDFTIEHSENFVENVSINHGVDGKNGADGKDGQNGKNGINGKDGYTPVRGVDYWTDEDKAEIKAYVDEAFLGGAW